MLLWEAERRVGGELLVNALHEFSRGGRGCTAFPNHETRGRRTQAGGELARRAAAVSVNTLATVSPARHVVYGASHDAAYCRVRVRKTTCPPSHGVTSRTRCPPRRLQAGQPHRLTQGHPPVHLKAAQVHADFMRYVAPRYLGSGCFGPTTTGVCSLRHNQQSEERAESTPPSYSPSHRPLCRLTFGARHFLWPWRREIQSLLIKAEDLLPMLDRHEPLRSRAPSLITACSIHPEPVQFPISGG